MKPWWLETPWRMVQANLREMDLEDMDPQRFAEDLAELRATVVMVSTSGIVANYPTCLPYQYRNPYASDTILADVIDACHQKGIRVIGRMDFSKVREPMSTQHPEWAFVGEGGQRVCYNGDTHVCCNSQYQRVLSLNILKETLSLLPLDGVFFNFGGYTSGYDYSGNLYGDCVCENCQARFLEMFHQPLPSHPAQSPLYEAFKRRTTAQAAQEVREAVQSIRPGLCIANDYFSGEGFYRAEAGSGGGADWTYSASELASRARTGYPNMRASITTVDFIDIAYRYASPGKERQQLRLAQSMAQGGSPDLYLMGRPDNREDPAGKEAAKPLFAWHQRHEEDYNRLCPIGELLLVRPETHWLLGGQALKEYRGWFEMLAQNHFLFQAVDESRLAALELGSYRAVLLPGLSLSPESERVLKAYLKQGGKVLATLGDAPPEWLGVRLALDKIEDTRGAYIRLNQGKGETIQIEPETSLLPVVGGYLRCTYQDQAFLHGNLINPHPYGPPERCFYTETDVASDPGYTVYPYGKGTALWIPWPVGAGFGFGRQPQAARWMRGLLEKELGAVPIETTAPACVEVTLGRRDGNALLLHLVNESGCAAGVWGEPLPLGEITVAFPCPRPSGVVPLGNEPCRWTWRDGKLTIRIEPRALLTAVRVEQ